MVGGITTYLCDRQFWIHSVATCVRFVWAGTRNQASTCHASNSYQRAEWRTAPLWGIGLTTGVSGGEAYLHNGRARTLEEAILWHGGEGEQSMQAFRRMPLADRNALLMFLKSL